VFTLERAITASIISVFNAKKQNACPSQQQDEASSARKRSVHSAAPSLALLCLRGSMDWCILNATAPGKEQQSRQAYSASTAATDGWIDGWIKLKFQLLAPDSCRLAAAVGLAVCVHASSTNHRKTSILTTEEGATENKARAHTLHNQHGGGGHGGGGQAHAGSHGAVLGRHRHRGHLLAVHRRPGGLGQLDEGERGVAHGGVRRAADVGGAWGGLRALDALGHGGDVLDLGAHGELLLVWDGAVVDGARRDGLVPAALAVLGAGRLVAGLAGGGADGGRPGLVVGAEGGGGVEGNGDPLAEGGGDAAGALVAGGGAVLAGGGGHQGAQLRDGGAGAPDCSGWWLLKGGHGEHKEHAGW